MSGNSVWRPDLKDPDTFWLKAEDTMTHWIERGLKDQANELHNEIQEHIDLCGPGATVCNLRNKKLVETYGSIEEAAKHEPIIRNCLQDLAYLYTQLGLITGVLYQIHELRLDPSNRGDDPELTDWTPREKLQEIQAEMTHRTERSKTDTALMGAIRDEEDSDPTQGPDKSKSILGLTDDLPPIGTEPVKPATEPEKVDEEPIPTSSETNVSDDISDSSASD